jgi:acetyltransferase-like isoleucine patch superfamily enzyme
LKDINIQECELGGGCRLFSKISTGEPYLIQIGNNVTISTNVSLITHDNSAIKCFDNGTDFVGKIVIGDNCFIGSGSIILPGVSIANNTIIGSGSVVTKSIEEIGTVVAGNPAKKIGTVTKIKEKYVNNLFNFKGASSNRKKEMILNNSKKWIRK